MTVTSAAEEDGMQIKAAAPLLVGLDDSTARFLHHLLQDAVTGMAVLGPDGRFRAVNRAMCRILGRREEDLLGTSPSTVTHPDDQALSEKRMLELVGGAIATDQTQKRYLRPDGGVVTVVRTTTVIRDRDEQPIGMFTQVIDMTAAFEAQESVGRSEKRFRALVAHASDATILLDGTGRITYASPASLHLLGHCPEELIGRHALDFIHSEDLDRATRMLAFHLSSAEPTVPATYRLRHRDGTWRTAAVVSTNLFADDSVGAMVINIRDVTEETVFRDQLAASERKFRMLVGNSFDLITIHEPDGRYLYCSPAVSAQLGYRPDELIGTDPFALIHPDDVGRVRAFWDGDRSGGDSVQYRIPHRDGPWRWMESILQDCLDEPAIAGILVTTRDVTVRQRRAAQQEALTTLSSVALRGGPIEALCQQAVQLVARVIDADYCDVVYDAGTPDERRGAHHGERGEVPSGAGPSEAGSAVATVIPAAGTRTSSLNVYSGSADSFSEGDVAFLESAANVLASAMTRDRIEGELRVQALHDILTGLPNRTLLQDRMETALARLGRHDSCVAVLFVDLDNFKLVNDSLGHPAGDQLVATVAGRLSTVIRSSDTVARFGGDEFVVLCEETDPAAAGDLAERVRRAVCTPLQLEGRAVTITASIGIATTADRTTSPEELLSMADTAMYASKESGKDCATLFALHMRTEATERLDAMSGIRRALAHEEFRLVYQPIVNAANGTDHGCESLVRWQHPTEGLLAPSHFIDYAEASGLIIPLGEWVLRTACGQSAAWRRAGRLPRLSVNVSALQLTQSDLVATVASALEDTGALPRDLYLEVTEHAVMSDVARATETIHRLHELGVKIGMDDFGTGHSSLSQLADLPFDYVKVDRSFIQRFDQDRRTAALLESIITLCRALDLPTIAEGVETPEQMRRLTGLGISFVQGFLFGRPVPAEEYDRRSLPSRRPEVVAGS